MAWAERRTLGGRCAARSSAFRGVAGWQSGSRRVGVSEPLLPEAVPAMPAAADGRSGDNSAEGSRGAKLPVRDVEDRVWETPPLGSQVMLALLGRSHLT